MSSRRTPAFRALSTVVAVVTGLYLCGGGYTRAWAAEAQVRAEWQRALEHLRVEERLLTDPEGFEAERKKDAQERREGALEKLREHAQLAAQEVREKAVRAEVATLQQATPEGAVRYELAQARAQGDEGAKLQARLSPLSAPLARARGCHGGELAALP